MERATAEEQARPPTTADAACRLAETIAWMFNLDFSPGSLSRVDGLLETWHAALVSTAGDRVEEAHWLANLSGCYLGEVVIRTYGGQWRPSQETEFQAIPGMEAFPLVLELPNGLVCSPLSKPFKLLSNGLADSLAGFYEGVLGADQERRPGWLRRMWRWLTGSWS